MTSETIQDLIIQDYLLNKHDLNLISKYTTEGQLERTLAKPIISVKQDIDHMIQAKSNNY
jgi:hypothetical protein